VHDPNSVLETVMFIAHRIEENVRKESIEHLDGFSAVLSKNIRKVDLYFLFRDASLISLFTPADLI
jgi:hypothetical protein